MEKLRGAWTKAIQKNSTLVLLTILLILSGWGNASIIIQSFLPDKTTRAFELIIDRAVQRSMDKHMENIDNKIQDAKDHFAVELCFSEFGRYKNINEIDSRIKFIYDSQWKAQETGMRIVAKSPRAQEKLEKYLLEKKFLNRILNRYR
jgi:multidrug efflux pump subunit AcrB